MSSSLIAICLCTTGVRESLVACLDSLRAQILPEDCRLEIIVVDNGQTELDRGKPGLAATQGHPVYFYREPRPGIPVARNAALKAARERKADWIAFIDDDEIAPSFWISRMHEAARLNSADVVVGGLFRGKTLQEAIELARARQPAGSLGNLPRVKSAVTSNVLFSARLIDDSYNLTFDEAMIFGGSDREFFMRAGLLGAKMVITDQDLVFETWPVEKTTPSYVLTRWFRFGMTFNYRYRKNYSPVKGVAIIFLMFMYKLVGSPIKFLFLPLRLFWDKRPFIRVVGASLADVAYALGCIAPFFGITLNRYY